MENLPKDPYQDLLKSLEDLKIVIENLQEIADEAVDKLKVIFKQN